MIRPEIVNLLRDKINKVSDGDRTNILVGPIQLPVQLDGATITFQWYSWLPVPQGAEGDEWNDMEGLLEKLSTMRLAESQQSSVLVYGDFKQAEEPYIRMHSICHTGDIFGSERCDCGYQLKQSMRMIVAHGSGALFYLADHEGRGIGLFSKAVAYLLQEKGLDTVEANLELGFADDARSYEDAIRILRFLREKPVALITNNPRKVDALKSAGMHISRRISLWGDVTPHNERYLQTKIKRSGHLSAVNQ